MQTYVPLPNLVESATILSDTDLAEQLDAVLTALDLLHQVEGDAPVTWDPEVKMWAGYEVHLATYGLNLLEEAASRKIQFPHHEVKSDRVEWHLECATSGDFGMEYPKWMGDDRLHDSHKAALIRKNPHFYRRRFASIDKSLPMFWPEIS